ADVHLQRVDTELPLLLVAIDHSASMSLPQDPMDDERIDRLSAIQSAFEEMAGIQLNQLQRDWQIRFYSLGSSLESLSADSLQDLGPDAPQSLLGDGLQQLLDQNAFGDLAAITLFSDGAVTGGTSLDEFGRAAAARDIPVFCIGSGSEQLPPNVRIQDVAADRRMRANHPAAVTVSVDATSLDGSTGRVSIVDTVTENELASGPLMIESDQWEQTIPLEIRFSEAGPQSLRAVVEVEGSESGTDDNQREFSVTVVDDPVRVLLIQDFPDPGYRFLKQSLRRAVEPITNRPLFELSTLLQQSSAEYAAIDSTAIDQFPDADELQEFDVVVVGDVRMDPVARDRGLTAANLQDLNDYVRSRAGNCVFVVGPRHWKEIVAREELEGLWPFRQTGNSPAFQLQDFRLQWLPPAGNLGLPFDEQAEITIRARFNTGFSLKPTAIRLAELVKVSAPIGVTYPGITRQKFGRGSVVFHFVDELYRLRYRTGEAVFEQYWTRLVSQLAASRLQQYDQRALLRRSTEELSEGDPLELTAEILDTRLIEDSVFVRLVNDAGDQLDIPLQVTMATEQEQVLFATVNELAAGRYRAMLLIGRDHEIAAPVVFTVQPRSEFDVLTQQKYNLERLATMTGGRWLPLQDIDELWESLPAGLSRQPVAVTSRRIWSWPFVPAFFALTLVGLLTVEWVYRRQL
ncbi:MAG: hypothetical protein ACR2NP_18105, partial [Pirellulaceae bacterium]